MKEYDYSETDEDKDDWDDADEEWYESMQPIESLSKKNTQIIENNVLTLMENSLRKKIKDYRKEGYPYEDYPEEDVTSTMTVMDRISLLEKRMDALMSWLKTKHGYKGSPYKKYPDTEKKLSLRDSVIEELSKKPFWNDISPEQREKETREEMLRIALNTRGQRDSVLEKELLAERSLIDDIDRGFKEKKDPIDGTKLDSLMTWAEYLRLMETQHTDLMEKYYFLIASLDPKRVTSNSKYSNVRSETIALPEPTPLPTFKREDFKPFIKDYGKVMKMSKEELSQMEDLHKEFPDLNPSELDRLRLLRRCK